LSSVPVNRLLLMIFLNPMHSPDGRYSIVFNGEIYNHESIRKDLRSKGYEYRSKTDTETILYGYREYGKDIVNKLNGMWAFAIWDNQKRELFCARDRIGIKPFYYTRQNGRFLFGSEIKSILQHPAISAELNEAEIPNYLNYGMSGRTTLFKDIVKLSAGNSLIINAQGEVKIERYWSPIAQNQQYTQMDAVECQDETLRILRMAVDDRMMSDVPFGVFLSGGVDSSLNVALMAELMDRPIDTYTVGFKELEQYNELEYARKVSKLFHTNHHEILIDEKDAFPILQELTWYEDEPNADPVCIPLWFLSKLTRDSGTTVIQVGEGSDEQFVGYSWMLREYNFYKSYWKFFTSLPQFARKIIYQGIKPILIKANQLLMLDYFRRATENDELYWGGISIMSPSHLGSIFNKDFHHLTNITADFAGTLHDEARSFHAEADFLQRALYVELSQRLSEILLMRVDKIGMAHSIEARVPFLDHRLVEFTMSIPPSIKTPDNKLTKYSTQITSRNCSKSTVPASRIKAWNCSQFCP
jgi:asparagine synthase (glutamine-hydrolysing)